MDIDITTFASLAHGGETVCGGYSGVREPLPGQGEPTITSIEKLK